MNFYNKKYLFVLTIVVLYKEHSTYPAPKPARGYSPKVVDTYNGVPEIIMAPDSRNIPESQQPIGKDGLSSSNRKFLDMVAHNRQRPEYEKLEHKIEDRIHNVEDRIEHFWPIEQLNFRYHELTYLVHALTQYLKRDIIKILGTSGHVMGGALDHFLHLVHLYSVSNTTNESKNETLTTTQATPSTQMKQAGN